MRFNNIRRGMEASINSLRIRISDSTLLGAFLSNHRGDGPPIYVRSGMIWSNEIDDGLYVHDMGKDRKIAVNKGTPPQSDSPGCTGDVAWDNEYFYACTGPNVWKRTKLETW